VHSNIKNREADGTARDREVDRSRVSTRSGMRLIRATYRKEILQKAEGFRRSVISIAKPQKRSIGGQRAAIIKLS